MTDFFGRIEKKERQAQSWSTSLLRTLHSTILRWSYVKNNLEKNTKLAVANFGNFQSLLYIVVVKNECPILAVFLFPTQGFKRERCKEQRPKNDKRTLLFLLETGQRPLTR